MCVELRLKGFMCSSFAITPNHCCLRIRRLVQGVGTTELMEAWTDKDKRTLVGSLNHWIVQVCMLCDSLLLCSVMFDCSFLLDMYYC